METDSADKEDHSQFMDGAAIGIPKAVKNPKKRDRGPRISAYIDRGNRQRLLRMAKRLGCDASHITLSAVLALLDKEQPAETLARLEASADREALRRIVFQAMRLLQEVNWRPYVFSPDQPLERQLDAVLASRSLAKLEDDLESLLRRVAELLAKLDGQKPATINGTGSDASQGPTEGGLS